MVNSAARSSWILIFLLSFMERLTGSVSWYARFSFNVFLFLGGTFLESARSTQLVDVISALSSLKDFNALTYRVEVRWALVLIVDLHLHGFK